MSGIVLVFGRLQSQDTPSEPASKKRKARAAHFLPDPALCDFGSQLNRLSDFGVASHTVRQLRECSRSRDESSLPVTHLSRH
jgi:hypothetical protein